MNENKTEEKINEKENKIENSEENIKQEKQYIKTEYIKQLKEYKNLTQLIIKSKETFRSIYSEFTTKKNSLVEKEKEIESLLIKISKIRKKLLIALNKSINAKFYSHLEEISGDKQKEKALIKFFKFTFNLYNITGIYHFQQKEIIDIKFIEKLCFDEDEKKNMKNILKIIKNESEIKNLILYLYEIIQNLYKDETDIYNKIKDIYFKLYNELSEEERKYPLEILYDFIKNIFNIIEYEIQVENKKILLNVLTLEKNTKYIEMKNLQSLINGYLSNKKLIGNYMKTLNAILSKLNEQSPKKSNEDIKELNEEIEKYKKIITNNESINNNFDALTSASVNNIIIDKSMNKNITEYRNIDSKINSFESIFKNHIKSIEEKKTPNNNTDYLVVVKKGKVNMKKNFEKANKVSNINNKRISKNENKSLYIKRNIQRNKNKNLIPSYQAIYKKTLTSLNKKNLINFSINNIKYNNNTKTNLREKSYDKSNKKQIDKNKEKLKIKLLMPKFKSQKIKKSKNKERNFKSTKEINNIHTLNNHIFNTNKNEMKFKKNNKNIFMHYLTCHNENNKTDILPKKNELEKNSTKKTLKLSNSEKKNENDLVKNRIILSNQKEFKFDKNENDTQNISNIQTNKDQTRIKELNNFPIIIPIQKKMKDYNNTDSFNIKEIKDSICDEMTPRNNNSGNYLIKATKNNYISKLGIKRNLIWSENLYHNKTQNKNENNKNLKIEKPIDNYACCTSCT